MPFCSQCGSKMLDDARFCQKCGKPSQGTSMGSGAPLPVAQPLSYHQGQPAASTQYVIWSENVNLPEVATKAAATRNAMLIGYSVFILLGLLAVLVFIKENQVEALGGWLFVTALIIVFTLIGIAKQNKTWIGVVEDKRIVVKVETDDDSSFQQKRKIPTLFIRTDKGKREKIEFNFMSGAAFEYYNIGDHVRKLKGFPMPEKYIKGPDLICVYCGKIFPISENRCPKCKLVAMK